MPTIQQPAPNQTHHIFKWGGTVIFTAVVLLAAGLITYLNRASQEDGSNTVSTRETAQPIDTAVGPAAPTIVQSNAELTSSEVSLDSADLESFSAELDANDADLAAF